jgi:hypothetical protein
MRISLVPDIPYNRIFGRRKYPVQSHCQLNHAQVAGKMTALAQYDFNQFTAQFLTQAREQPVFDGMQIRHLLQL